MDNTGIDYMVPYLHRAFHTSQALHVSAELVSARRAYNSCLADSRSDEDERLLGAGGVDLDPDRATEEAARRVEQLRFKGGDIRCDARLNMYFRNHVGATNLHRAFLPQKWPGEDGSCDIASVPRRRIIFCGPQVLLPTVIGRWRTITSIMIGERASAFLD